MKSTSSRSNYVPKRGGKDAFASWQVRKMRNDLHEEKALEPGELRAGAGEGALFGAHAETPRGVECGVALFYLDLILGLS